MRILFTCLLALSFSAPAQAVMIKNLSEAPQSVEFARAPNSFETYEIEPFDSIYIAGPGRIRPVGSDEAGIYGWHRDMFTIWPDGKIARQMRRGKGGRRD